MKSFPFKTSWLRSFCLASAVSLAPLLGGCAANYHFCPGGAAEDPSRPFAPCKTAPSEPQTR
jgi:hypothetical protein